MRNDTLSIFKKEMDRFLHNKASAAAAIILPGLVHIPTMDDHGKHAPNERQQGREHI